MSCWFFRKIVFMYITYLLLYILNQANSAWAKHILVEFSPELYMLGFPSKLRSTFYKENIGSSLEFCLRVVGAQKNDLIMLMVDSSYSQWRRDPTQLLNIGQVFQRGDAGGGCEARCKGGSAFPCWQKQLGTDCYLNLISIFPLKEIRQYFQLLLGCFTSSEVWL